MGTMLSLENTVHFYSYMRYMLLHTGRVRQLITIEMHSGFQSEE